MAPNQRKISNSSPLSALAEFEHQEIVPLRGPSGPPPSEATETKVRPSLFRRRLRSYVLVVTILLVLLQAIARWTLHTARRWFPFLRRPSQPLCPECLQIVQQTTPLALNYVNVQPNNEPPKEAPGDDDGSYQARHPHAGAKDLNGHWGYVHDVTELRRQPPSLLWDTPNQLQSVCQKHDSNYYMLTKKIQVTTEAKTNKNLPKLRKKKRISLFCAIFTTDEGHTHVELIRQTWGPKCDGFLAASNKTDATLHTVNIPHDGDESRENLWQKVRSVWSYIYDHYYHDYDWFHLGSDDMYLIVENLRQYLQSEEMRTAANGGLNMPSDDGQILRQRQIPLYLGRRMAYQGNRQELYNIGGPGYTLNKAALKLLVTQGFPEYYPQDHTEKHDVLVGRILAKMGVIPYETKDSTGGERYNLFTPGHHYNYRYTGNESLSKPADWHAHSLDFKEGTDHCAAYSVAFHFVGEDTIKRIHALLYGMCPSSP